MTGTVNRWHSNVNRIIRRAFAEFNNSALGWELRRVRDRVSGVSPERSAEGRFYAALLGKEQRGWIIDIGANVGSKVEVFRKIAERVLAIEPDPFAAETLRRRFRLRRNVEVAEVAVSDQPGEIELHQFAPGSAFNTADQVWAEAITGGENHMKLKLEPGRRIRVRSTTMPAIEARCAPIIYLKVDVEGLESKVLSQLSSAIPLVSLEFNLPSHHRALVDCVRKLASLGPYQFNVAISEPPVRFELEWSGPVSVIAEIDRRAWGYVELYARVRTG